MSIAQANFSRCVLLQIFSMETLHFLHLWTDKSGKQEITAEENLFHKRTFSMGKGQRIVSHAFPKTKLVNIVSQQGVFPKNKPRGGLMTVHTEAEVWFRHRPFLGLTRHCFPSTDITNKRKTARAHCSCLHVFPLEGTQATYSISTLRTLKEKLDYQNQVQLGEATMNAHRDGISSSYQATEIRGSRQLSLDVPNAICLFSSRSVA